MGIDRLFRDGRDFTDRRRRWSTAAVLAQIQFVSSQLGIDIWQT